MRLKTPQLVDSFAQAAIAAKRATKAAEVLRKQVLERMDATEARTLTGTLYVVDRSRVLRETISLDEVRAVLDAAQLAACTRTSAATILNYHLRDEVTHIKMSREEIWGDIA